MVNTKLLESRTLDVIIPMHVIAQHADWALCQFVGESWAELIIYNTKTRKVFARYQNLQDDELIDDWYRLTEEGGSSK